MQTSQQLWCSQFRRPQRLQLYRLPAYIPDPHFSETYKYIHSPLPSQYQGHCNKPVSKQLLRLSERKVKLAAICITSTSNSALLIFPLHDLLLSLDLRYLYVLNSSLLIFTHLPSSSSLSTRQGLDMRLALIYIRPQITC